jgi:eukaryotic-like serine/threonine-protein kinase
MTDEEEPIPDELDDGLAFAYGEESTPPTSPSVLERIGEITGSKPQVLLRDDRAGDTPMLKPLGPDARVEAGKYVVHGELGRGGVGTVHRGHDQDLGRDVAMKFLHEKYKDTPEILHRFVEEAQIGGQLQHPGIVPVYDLGMVDGKPFFSMKLVKGQTLAKKLVERASPADDRRTFLAIFEDVCQTLAYAHARGVVHRDLKPANIMIGSFGEVQVVDWGMGKVMKQGGVADEQRAAEQQTEVSVIETVRSDGHGSQSLMGSVMGTPAYMPPEQARGDVDAMDERSDVFALGAILCEILTGKPPYVGEQDELIAMAAMAKLDDAYARLESCEGEPEMVELATRCLMPAPAARPRSAEVVAQTVHAHLAAVESRVHEARVEAAEAKVRAAALKRTQQLGIGLTTVIAVGLAASLWFWRAADTAAENEKIAKLAAVASAKEAKQNEQLAVEQTEVATRELARAVEIKTLITEMLQSVTPEQAKGADITLLKGILDAASERLAEGAIEDELVAAELHTLTGSVYQGLGLYAEAERHMPVALEIRKRILGEEHPDTLVSMNRLADLYQHQKRYPEAELLMLQTLEIRTRVLGEEDPLTLSSMNGLASVQLRQNRHEEAEALCLETLEKRERVLGEEHAGTLQSMGTLASIYWFQGRYDEAEPLFLRVLDFDQRVLGEDHPSTLQRLNNLALLYREQNRFAEAVKPCLQAFEIQKRVMGEQHPNTLVTMDNLAGLYCRQSRFSEAEPLYLQKLEIQKRRLGEEHADTLASMNNLALVYANQLRYAEAESLQLQSLEIHRRVLGEEHPKTLVSLGNLAFLYDRQGRHDEAEPLLLQLLETQKRVLGEEHPHTLMSMGGLALIYDYQGRYDEAAPLYLQALELMKRVLGEEHPDTLGSITNLGNLYNSMERFEHAAAMFEVSLPIKRRVLGTDHPWTASAMSGLAEAYMQLGRPEDALPLQRELLDLQLALADEVNASAKVLNSAAWDLLTVETEDLRDPERALGFAKRACALADKEGGEPNPNHLDTLALAQHRTGDTRAAIETQKRALALIPEGADPEMTERLAEYEAASKGN